MAPHVARAPRVSSGESRRGRLGASGPNLLFGLVAASLLLRLYGLNGGLWYDEIATYASYARMSFADIVKTYDSQNQSFLYSLLARASFAVFGESAWALRMPAVLFGAASVGALYLLGREVASRAEALLAAAFLTFSYHHIWFSQNARPYTGLLFWTLLSSWLVLRALKDGRPRLWLLYAVAASLGVYTSMTMLFVIIGHMVVSVARLLTRPGVSSPRAWRGPCLGFLATGLFTVLLHAPVLSEITSGGAIWNVGSVAAWKNPLWTLLELARGLEIGLSSAGVVLAVLLTFGVGVASFARSNPAMVLQLFIPVSLCAGVILALGHPLWPRFFFFASGFAALFLVRGLTDLGRLGGRSLGLSTERSAAAGMVLAGLLIAVSALSLRTVYGPKQDYLGALGFVEARKEPGDAVVTVGLTSFPYLQFYRTGWREARSLNELESIRADARRTWLLYTFPLHLEAVHGELMTAIKRDFQLVAEFRGSVGDGTVFVCLGEGPAVPSASS
jgi:mannosyltransferase